jgi:ArsR family transcriptional regulator, cadmium/lead-responsive transcriptional repressor
MDWQKYSYVIASPIRTSIIKLMDKELTPKEIVSSLKKSDSNISRALRQLSNQKIIICLTPKQKRGRIYKLTEEGIEIQTKLKE